MNPYLQLLSDKKLTLIMSLPKNDPDLARTAFDAGADVVKVHINVQHRASGTGFGRLAQEKSAIQEMLDYASGRPMGLVPGGSLKACGLDLYEVCSMPFSFLSLYGHHVPARLIPSPIPLMAACDSTYSLDEVDVMEQCGASILEASIIPGQEYGQPLSYRDLLHYRMLVRRTALPVVVPTQRHILPEDVPALIQTGIRGLMIGAIVTGNEKDTIRQAVEAFRNAIERNS